MFYTLVLVSAIQKCESSICIHISPPSHALLHPTPLGYHRALSWAPCVVQQLPTSCLKHGNVYASLTLFQLVSPPASCPVSTSLFPIFASLFLPSQTLFSHLVSIRKTEMCNRQHTIQMNGKVTAWFSLSPFGLQKCCET